MPIRSVVQIEAQHPSGSRWGSGCVVQGGYVLTAAHLVAPRGQAPEEFGGLILRSKNTTVGAVRRMALLDYWTEALSSWADMALLEVAWQDHFDVEPFEIRADWSIAGDTKSIAAFGYDFDAALSLWAGRAEVTHVRSNSGLEVFESKQLAPPAAANGGPLTPEKDTRSLVGIVAHNPVQGVHSQVGLPLSIHTYGSLRRQLERASTAGGAARV